MMKNKFNFYEIVRVTTLKSELNKINGKEGVVLGMSQSEDDGSWGYAITIIEDGYFGWDVMEEDLQPTGKKAKKEDFYTGESIKVRVNPKTGEGEIVEDEES